MLRSPVADYAEMREQQLGPFGIEAWKKLGIMYVSHRRDRKGYILKYNFYKDALAHKAYSFIPKIRAATLIVHGDKDDYVPLHQFRKIYSKLKVRDKKIITIRGCDHHYSNPNHKKRMLKLIANWFVMTL